jgi:hypothetical protein
VVSTRCFHASGGLSDAVAWLDAVTPEDLAQELTASLHAPPPLLSGRECVLRGFTWDAVARRVDRVYMGAGTVPPCTGHASVT